METRVVLLLLWKGFAEKLSFKDCKSERIRSDGWWEKIMLWQARDEINQQKNDGDDADEIKHGIDSTDNVNNGLSCCRETARRSPSVAIL